MGDKSAIPEADMLKQMWNGGSEPPQTANPELVKLGKTVSIRCATRGASVGYILKHGPNQSNVWQVYGGQKLTLESGDSLRVVAQRIGYQPSSEVKLKE